MLFDTFYNKTTITGIIRTIDPIHIGSSNNEGLDPTQVDNSVIKDAVNNPYIPGSALKGVLRSNFEAVLRSVGKTVCDVFDTNDEKCVTNQFMKEVSEKNIGNKEKAEKIYEKSCEVCKLFGGRGIASKLQFKDCTFDGGKCIYEYRDGVGIDRKTGAAKPKAKFNYEIVPKGTCFSFYMIAENLDEQQEKYLDYVIRVLESGEIAVGGKTTRGLGRIVLEKTERSKKTCADLVKELGLEG